MEGSRHNPNGAGGHHDDAAGRKTHNALRSMMDDLGHGRMEDLAQDDDRLTRGDRMLGAAPAKPKPNASNVWQSAVQGNVFEDSDARDWQDLDPIADGRLHAVRRDARAGGGNGPRGLGMVQVAQSNGHHGAQTHFGNSTRGSPYDPQNPQRRGGSRSIGRGHSTPIGRGHSTPIGRGGPTNPGRGGSSHLGRGGHHQSPGYGSDQVSPLGILVPPGAQVFTFRTSGSVSSTPQPTPPPSQPIQLRSGGSAPVTSCGPAQPQRNGATIFDAPSGPSTLNNNQKRSASHQEGSNPIFSSASVAGVTTRPPLSSSETNANTNTPSHKRLKAALPHLRSASVRPEAIASGSASYAGATQPSRSAHTRTHPSDTGKLPRSTPKPQSQPDVNILFESTVEIRSAQRDADGTIPDSGKVLLYIHPGHDGWMIWELQGNNGFITRDDVRAFFPVMPMGSSVIFRRRLPDKPQVAYTHNLLFPSMIAAQELQHLIEDGQKRMNDINGPWFQQGPLKVERLGLVDVYTLLEFNQASGSTQTTVQTSTAYNNQANPQAIQEATRGTHGAQRANHNEVQRDSTVPPHKRTVNNTAPVQASETIEGNSVPASQSTHIGTSGAQEDSSSSLIDMTSPMPTKLIEVEAEGKGKRPASEDLRDLSYETSLTSARVEPASKQPSPEANGGPSNQSLRPNMDVAKQVEPIDANASKYDNQDQHSFSRPGSASGTNHLNATFSGRNDTSQNDDDHIDDQDTTSETEELDSKPEQNTELGLAPSHNTIKVNDVKRKLPIRYLSSASKNLVMGMTHDKYIGMKESVKGLWNACVQMDMFPERRLETATLLSTWQALYQNAAFRGFNDDDKLNTVAFVYDKVYRGLASNRITYSIYELIELCHRNNSSSDDHLTRTLNEKAYKGYQATTNSTVANTQSLTPSTPAAGRAVASASPASVKEPSRLTPPPDVSQPMEQQCAVESTSAFIDNPDHSSSPVTPTPSASSETNTLGQKADNTEKAIKQEDQEPVIKVEPHPEFSSFASQVPVNGANWMSQTPAKQAKMVSVAIPQTPSPLTSTQNSQVPGNRTGSQGPGSVPPHMRGIRQNLDSDEMTSSTLDTLAELDTEPKGVWTDKTEKAKMMLKMDDLARDLEGFKISK
ncbi:hypothetical protein PG993_012401 [Apiospora rasikravindrae]|uniref:SH3 domain-containing protein n=1 Tax=Apiospora rasikravindrae TaxID=990691 RepID=A0ABR1S3S3_9PEZI